MSKTFKSAFDGSKYRLEVCKYTGAKHTSLWIIGGGDHAETIAIADKVIPNLMLALGEAAGVVPKWEPFHKHGTPEHLAHILSHLQQYVDAQEAIAAQAEETAKLEAEALELRNAGNVESGGIVIGSLDVLTTTEQQKWLAVARKARELGN